MGDALRGHLPGVNMPPKRQGGQDAGLPAGVVALNVGRGIPLGIAVVLGLLQGVLKGQASADHPGEDIVGGAVEDARDLSELIGGEALTDGADDRDTAAHAGLEEIAHAVLLGQLKQLIAVGGHQLLVRGDHALARVQGAAGIIQRNGGAANGLHHHIHLGVILDDGEIVDDLVGKNAVREVTDVQNILDGHLIGNLLEI